jgi:hypothetical protein
MAQLIDEHARRADWEHLYRDPHCFKKVVERAFGDGPDGEISFSHLLLGLAKSKVTDLDRKVHRYLLPPDELKKQEMVAVEFLREEYRKKLRRIESELIYQNYGPALSDEEVKQPELQFFLLVFLPCMLEFGMTPMRLSARARRGDRQSLFDLLRTDKSIARHPQLKEQISESVLQADSVFREMYAQAISKGMKYNPKPARLKAQAGALLIMLSEAMYWKLNPTEVRQLYDAVQKVKTGNPEATDVDLPEFDEGWRQAIYRDKNKWVIDLARNIKSQENCDAKKMKHLLVCQHDDTGEIPAWVRPYLQPSQPRKLGFCERVKWAWERFNYKVRFQQERQRRLREMASQSSRSRSSKSK